MPILSTILRVPRPVRAAALTCAAAALGALAPSVPAASGPQAAPASALLFKSGHAALERTVRVERGATSVAVPLPVSIHGGVWVDADGARIASAVARLAPHVERRPIESIDDLVRASVGRRVSLHLDEDRTLTGEIVRVLDGAPDAVGDPTNGTYRRPPSWSSLVRAAGSGPAQPPPSVAIRAGERIHVLPLGRVRHVAVEEDDAGDWTWSAPRERPTLEVRFAEPVGRDGATLRLRSLSAGLAWAPSYALRLSGDRGRLVGKAAIVNDLTELRDTAVRLVVGYLNLKHAHVESPLSPALSLEHWVRRLDFEPTRRRNGNPMLSNQAVLVPVGGGFDAGAFDLALPGDSSEDLFVHHAGRLTLDTGERAYLPLSDEGVAVEHRFDWVRESRVREDRRFRDDDDAEANDVWHVLVLTNGGEAPWTTAPVLIEGDAGPLAQSTLHYTPPGAETTVRMTKALGLEARGTEHRVAASAEELETVRLFGETYVRVEVAGTLELVNRTGRPTPVRVAQELRGDVLLATGEPRRDAPVDDASEVNALRRLTWETELAPGESWSAEYRYEVLIRR